MRFEASSIFSIPQGGEYYETLPLEGDLWGCSIDLDRLISIEDQENREEHQIEWLVPIVSWDSKELRNIHPFRSFLVRSGSKYSTDPSLGWGSIDPLGPGDSITWISDIVTGQKTDVVRFHENLSRWILFRDRLGHLRCSFELSCFPILNQVFGDFVQHSRFDILPWSYAQVPARLPFLGRVTDSGPGYICDMQTGKKFMKEFPFHELNDWLDNFRPLWNSPVAYWGESQWDLP